MEETLLHKVGIFRTEADLKEAVDKLSGAYMPAPRT